MDPRHVGRRYGPYRFAAGLESIRDFAAAVSGRVPGRTRWAPPAEPVPPPEAAPPTYAAAFAMEAFSAAISDPALGIDLGRMLHGEQELEILGPVRPGDVLETTGEIASISRRGRLDLVTVATTSRNQRGEVVVRGTWTAVVRD